MHRSTNPIQNNKTHTLLSDVGRSGNRKGKRNGGRFGIFILIATAFYALIVLNSSRHNFSSSLDSIRINMNSGSGSGSGSSLATLSPPGNTKAGIVTNALSSTSSLPSTSTALALKESLGFFKDIPDDVWRRHKERFRLTQPNYNNRNKAVFERFSRYSNWFWANNFEPEFTCPHEFRLGKLGDGGKWVCDPHRILSDNSNNNNNDNKDSCIVYSIGSNGNFQFEVEALKHVAPSCEIHTFDLKDSGKKLNFADEAKKVGVSFHHWGLGTPSKSFQNMKTFQQMMTELNHAKTTNTGKITTIDLMKIDCEKCEYKQYKQWLLDWKELGVVVRQVLLEIHNSDLPGVVDLFHEFQKAGYVMFHKEANYINEGKAIEAAFLLLSPDFQK